MTTHRRGTRAPVSVTVTVHRIRHALAGALGWGRPTDTALALAIAAELYAPTAPPARAPEVAAKATAPRPSRSAARRNRRGAVRG
ncbi:hypothetical protein ACFQVC_34920 [Streptomyces monticola]|uniref:PucR family transcriptional regulator n=1 Tax=Streptomyces monticola TaxID=2666263 RepID=A0ABW2JT80_9ACTN